MDQKDTIRPFIEQHIKAGTAANDIKQQLTQRGWNAALVDEVIAEVTQGVSAAPFPAYTPPVFNQNQEITAQPNQLQAQPQSVTQVSASEGYGVIAASKDAFKAIKSNVVGVGVMSVVGFVVMILAVILVAVFFVSSIVAAIALSSEGTLTASSIFTVLISFVIMIIVMALASTFTQSLLGLAINDGADGKKTEFKETFRVAAKRAPRVLLATILHSLIAGAPLLAVLIIGIPMSMFLPSAALLILLLGLVALVAAPVLFLRLVLMPTIALFETETPVSKLPSRSGHLIKGGGIWFIIRFMVAVMVVGMVLLTLEPSEEEVENTSILASLTLAIVYALVSLFYSAILIVFYHNRKAVKDTQPVA